MDDGIAFDAGAHLYTARRLVHCGLRKLPAGEGIIFRGHGLFQISREDEMLANDMDTECRHLHDLNSNISYKIYETGSHPLIVSRAEEIAQLIKAFLVK